MKGKVSGEVAERERHTDQEIQRGQKALIKQEVALDEHFMHAKPYHATSGSLAFGYIEVPYEEKEGLHVLRGGKIVNKITIHDRKRKELCSRISDLEIVSHITLLNLT